MTENEKWLKETGYKQRPFDGTYYFEYRVGNYGAYNSFRLLDILELPLDYMKQIHKEFIEKAERKEEF